MNLRETRGNRNLFRTCVNIGWPGRLMRMATGLLFVFNGVILWSWGLPGTGVFSRALQVVFVLFGLFAVYEGAVGWCAMKAYVARRARLRDVEKPSSNS